MSRFLLAPLTFFQFYDNYYFFYSSILLFLGSQNIGSLHAGKKMCALWNIRLQLLSQFNLISNASLNFTNQLWNSRVSNNFAFRKCSEEWERICPAFESLLSHLQNVNTNWERNFCTIRSLVADIEIILLKYSPKNFK